MALRGSHLRVGAGVWVPWVDLHSEADGSLAYSGLISAFFDDIADKLNFTYTLHTPGDQEWGRALPNGSFTGLVGLCQRKEVDLVLGPLAMTWERFSVIDYSLPLYVDQYGIFLPRPKLEKDLGSVTKPLSWEVWIALAISLGISMVIAIIMKFVIERQINDDENCQESNRITAARPSSIIRIISTETVKHMPTSDSGRILLGTWMIGGFILQSAYSGVLTSLLTVPKVPIPVDSLQDLVDYGKIPWAIERGTFLDNQISKAKSGLYRKIREKAGFVTYVYVARNRIKDEGLAVLADIFTMEKIMSEDYTATAKCNYYIAKKKIVSASFALGFPKGSQLIQHFDRWLAPIKESGLLQQIMNTVIANATACMVKPGKENVNNTLVFSAIDLAGVFLLLGTGAVLSFVLLSLEKSLGTKVTRWSQEDFRKRR